MTKRDVTIGTIDGGGRLGINVPRLLVSRALVTSTSGGGKSYLLRKIVEEVSASTQTIVIDPEGEFASLREVRDMVLVGPDGDLPAEPAAAGLLCRRLMELNLSAVIDVSELTPARRREFVAGFCGTMVDLPRSLWRPCFVVIDEVHEFSPNAKDGGYVSAEPINLLFSKGRKRGFCPIVASQRVSNVSPNVTAEAKNRFIGQTTYDNDQRRAADFLGFGKDRWPELRDLSPPGREGEFFAVGPALSVRGVVRFRGGEVRSNHPRPGQGAAPEPPGPSKAIRSVLGELADLGRKAEVERVDLATSIDRGDRLAARVAELERALSAAQARGDAAPPAADRRSARQVTALRKGIEDAMKTIEQLSAPAEPAAVDPEAVRAIMARAGEELIKLVNAALSRRVAEEGRLRGKAVRLLDDLRRILGAPRPDGSAEAVADVPPPPCDPSPVPRRSPAADQGGRASLSATERAALDAAASFPGGATRQRISIFSGRSIKSSSFQAVFAGGEPKGERPSLVQRGLMRADGDRYVPTDAGLAIAEPTTGVTLVDWLGKLRPSEAKVLHCIADARPDRLTRGDVAERTGLSEKSSSFQAAFPALRELGLIEGKQDFTVPELLR